MARWISTEKDGEYIFIIRNLATFTIHDDEIEVLTNSGVNKFNLFLSDPHQFISSDHSSWFYLYPSNCYSDYKNSLQMHSAAMRSFVDFMTKAKSEILVKKFKSSELVDCINFKIGLTPEKLIRIKSDRFDMTDSFNIHTLYFYGQKNVLYIYDNLEHFETDKLAQKHSILVIKDTQGTFYHLLNDLKNI